MEVLFLIGATQSFFFSSLFLGKKFSIVPYRILVFFFFISGLLLLDHFFELKELNIKYPHLLGITYTLPILLGPLLYYYTISIINQNKFKRYLLIHLLPFLILTLYFFFDYYFLSTDKKLEYFYKESLGETSLPIYITEVFLNLSIPVYAILSLLKLIKHEKVVKQNYSNVEGKSLKWLKALVYFFIGISFIILGTNLFSDIIPIIDFLIGDNLIFGALTIGIFFFGYYGIRQRIVFPETLAINVKKGLKVSQYKKSGFKFLENSEYIDTLIKLMQINKPHLNPKLSLRDLAQQMQLSENNLSQLINEGLNKNFYDFINQYRVEEVKQMIVQDKYHKLSFLGIAYECGFNSKSSFNKIFKEVVGQTPSEFKKDYYSIK